MSGNPMVPFIIGIIGTLLGVFGLGAFVTTKRKRLGAGGLDATTVLGNMRFDIPSGCSASDISGGKCSLNGLGINCDSNLGTCNFDI